MRGRMVGVIDSFRATLSLRRYRHEELKAKRMVIPQTESSTSAGTTGGA